VLAVRAFLFTTYTVQVDIGHVLRKGDKVLVNKVQLEPIAKGTLLVFETPHTRQPAIGQVVALPGDTITFVGQRYRIPTICCDRCACPDCRLYLLDIGRKQTLVHKHQILGRANKIF
jgi:signal peptidase I